MELSISFNCNTIDVGIFVLHVVISVGTFVVHIVRVSTRLFYYELLSNIREARNNIFTHGKYVAGLGWGWVGGWRGRR